MSTVPNPLVTGPITGGSHGRSWMGAPFDLADYGYSQQEYLYTGTAKAYGAPGASEPYETRMLVYRPTDPNKFSGNVIVEWNNVTFQSDVPIDFVWLFPQIFAAGDAYVEISAQQAGICGAGLTGQPALSFAQLSLANLSANGISAAVCTPTSLKGWDSDRYAPLYDPGDQYSYDIYSQGAQAVVHPEGIAPLGGLVAKTVIAIGESQSAAELDDYIAYGADRAANLFDGFIIDADGHVTSSSSFYRVPTLQIWSEESAQPVTTTSGPNHVIWEVAGAPHLDHQFLDTTLQWLESDLLSEPPMSMQQEEAFQQAVGNYGQEGPGPSATCAGDSEFPRRYVVDAALSDMESWLNQGETAPIAPPLEFTGLAQATQQLPDVGVNVLYPTQYLNVGALLASPLALVRDSSGNAVGGLRLPVITAPVASYFGPACLLLGTSTALSPTELVQLYPTHADYVAQIAAAVQQSVADRFLTQMDGVGLLRRACVSAIPAWGTTPTSQQPPVCQSLGPGR